MSVFNISKNDLERFKIKVDKFNFIILRSFGVTEESSVGGGGGGRRVKESAHAVPTINLRLWFSQDVAGLCLQLIWERYFVYNMPFRK